MAVTLDTSLGTGKTKSGQNVTITTSGAAASGGLLLMTAIIFNTTTTGTFSVTATGGLTWVSVVSKTVSGNLIGQMFGAIAPAGLAASTTLTIQYSVVGSDMMSCAISLLGTDGTAVPAAFNTHATSATTAWDGGSLSAGGDGGVAVAFEDGDATATSTATSPAVEFADFNDATQTEAMTGVYRTGIDGASVTLAGTWSASETALTLSADFAAAGGQLGRTFNAIPFMRGVL